MAKRTWDCDVCGARVLDSKENPHTHASNPAKKTIARRLGKRQQEMYDYIKGNGSCSDAAKYSNGKPMTLAMARELEAKGLVKLDTWSVAYGIHEKPRGKATADRNYGWSATLKENGNG